MFGLIRIKKKLSRKKSIKTNDVHEFVLAWPNYIKDYIKSAKYLTNSLCCLKLLIEVQTSIYMLGDTMNFNRLAHHCTSIKNCVQFNSTYYYNYQ